MVPNEELYKLLFECYAKVDDTAALIAEYVKADQKANDNCLKCTSIDLMRDRRKLINLSKKIEKILKSEEYAEL